jgi:hypothetical protein
MPADPSTTPVVGRQPLRCGRCNRTDEVTHADLMTYMKRGWPTCRGEVMAYFTGARHPSTTAETEERPARS